MRMNKARRLWRICVDGRTASGHKIQLVIGQHARDAGEAWMMFNDSFSGATWERISVTEVKPDERPEQ